MTCVRIGLPALLATGLALGAPLPATAQQSLPVQTVPKIEGARFVVDGNTFTTDAQGRATVSGDGPGLANRVEVPPTRVASGVRVAFSRRDDDAYLFNRIYRVRLSFVDLEGRPIAAGRVSRVTLKGSHGVRARLRPGRARWLQGARVVPFEDGYRERRVTWVVEEVVVDGQNVVHRNQQRFEPSATPTFRISLLFYPAHFSVKDGLFGFATGSSVSILHPNGRVERYDLDANGHADVPSLPRGDYRVTVEGAGLSFEHPLALSREQEVDLQLLSYLDIAVVLGALAAIAIGLLHLGGRRLPWSSRLPWTSSRLPGTSSSPARPAPGAARWCSELHLDFSAAADSDGSDKALGAGSIVDLLGARRTLVVCADAAGEATWAENLRRLLPAHEVRVLPDAGWKRAPMAPQLRDRPDAAPPTVWIVRRQEPPLGGDGWPGPGEWDLHVVDNASRNGEREGVTTWTPGHGWSQRLVLSGTLVESRAEELVSVLSWLLPELYRDNGRDADHNGGDADGGVRLLSTELATVRSEPGVFLVYRRDGAPPRRGGRR